MSKVVHCKREKYDVYIGRGRGSEWGNPFSHQEGTTAKYKVATREEAIARYEEWIKTQPHLMASLWKLKGKVLGCWCHPKACHGDVLRRMADESIGTGSTEEERRDEGTRGSGTASQRQGS